MFPKGQSSRFFLLSLREYRTVWLLLLPVLTLVSQTYALAQTQVIPDHTLGEERSIVAPVDLMTDRIEGGAIRGVHLFHSFQDFSIPENRGAFFANPNGISNIFSRVTGENISNIFGTLGVLGEANLFFLNPNGILFGSNARLDLQGAFVGTTATSFEFGDGLAFGTIDPGLPPLLDVQVTAPVGFRFAGTSGVITNLGNLNVEDDLTLSAGTLDLQGQMVVGGDLRLQAQDTVQIRDSVELPFVASAMGELLIQGNESVDIFALNHPNSGLVAGEDLILRSANPVSGDAHFGSDGSFYIEQLDGEPGDLFSPHDPIILANEDVFLNSYTGASLHILAGGLVAIPGTVTITGPDTVNSLAQDITLSDGETVVSIDGGARPTLDIRAGVDWNQALGFLPNDLVFGSVFPFLGDLDPASQSADIVIGEVSLDPIGQQGGQVFLTNQYFPNALGTQFGGIDVGNIETGDLFGGGSVAIDSRSTVVLNGNINLSSLDASNLDPAFPINTHFGNGGQFITFAKGDIFLDPGATVESVGQLGGEVNFQSDSAILFDESIILIGNSSPIEGIGGDLTISAPSIFLINGTFIENSTFGKVDAGKIKLSANNLITLTGGSTLNSDTFGDGDSGAIEITTTDLVIQGDVTSVLVSGIFSSVNENAGGNSGGILINASNTVTLLQGASIGASTLGDGDSGRIEITTTDFLAQGEASPDFFSSVGTVVSSSATGNSGGIFLNASNNVSLLDGAFVSASTLGQGNAGAIEINTTDFIAQGESTSGFTSNVQSSVLPGAISNSASILINSSGMVSLLNGAFISASTLGQGNAGSIEINTTDFLVQGNSMTGLGGGISSSVEETAMGNSEEVVLNASGTVTLRDGAILEANTGGIGNAGAISLTTTEFLAEGETSSSLGSVSKVQSQVFQTGMGNSGGIFLNASSSVSLLDGAALNTSTQGQGNAGTIEINTTDFVIQGESDSGERSTLISQVAETATGNSANIILNASNTVSVLDGATLNASTFGNGDAGKIEITTTGFLAQGESELGFIVGIASQVGKTAVGDSGGIVLTASDTISILDGATIDTTTLGEGNAGEIEIFTTNLLIQGESSLGLSSGLSSVIGETGVGNSGRISLNASDTISVLEGAFVATNTLGQGNAGAIEISTSDFLVQGEADLGFRSGVTSVVGGTAIGRSEGIVIEASNTVSLLDGGNLNASTLGQGNAGIIKIVTTDFLAQGETSAGLGSNVSSVLFDTATGSSKGIVLNASDSVSLLDGAFITASTSGVGDAGAIEITTTDFLAQGERSLGFPSNVQSQVVQGARGNSRGISLNASRRVELLDGAILSTSTFGEGNAGEIEVITTHFLAQGESTMRSPSIVRSEVRESAIGDASKIRIDASETVYLLNGAIITASTVGEGNAGTIEIMTTNFLAQGESSVGLPSGLNSLVATMAVGDSGGINLTASETVSLLDGAILNTSTGGEGDAGAITITTTDFLIQGETTLGFGGNVGSSVGEGAMGNSGDITLNASRSVSLLEGGLLNASTFGRGTTGAIIITTTDLIAGRKNSLGFGSAILSVVGDNAIGDSKGIILNASGSVNLSDSAGLTATTFNQGDAGAITITTNDFIASGFDAGVESLVAESAVGSSGQITLNALSTVSLLDGANLNASTLGRGNAGAITITTTDFLAQGESNSGFSSFVASLVGEGVIGSSGKITLNASGSVVLLDGASLSASTLGQGNAGAIEINTTDLLAQGESSISGTSSDIQSVVASTAVGSSGKITLNAYNSVFLLDGANINASTLGRGDAGAIEINTRDFLAKGENSLGFTSRVNSEVGNSAIGRSGRIILNAADAVTLLNGAIITASAFGQGNAGNIEINTTEFLALGEASSGFSSGIGSQLGESAIGSSGDIFLNASSKVSIFDGGGLNATTRGRGSAGEIHVTTTDFLAQGKSSLEFASGIGSQLEETGIGSAGDIFLTASNSVSLLDGAVLSVNTKGKGNAGKITITTTDFLAQGEANIGSSSVVSQVFDTAQGSSGGISLNASRTVSLLDGATLSTLTAGQGNAGPIDISTRDFLAQGEDSFGQFSTIVSAVAEGASGSSGNILLTAFDTVRLLDGASLNASTFGQGNAGVISIITNDFLAQGEDSLGLSRGILSVVAEPASGSSGGISLDAKNTVSLLNGAGLNTSTLGQGNAGSILISTTDFLAQGEDSSGLVSNVSSLVLETATGDSGGITLSASDSVTLLDGAVLNTSTLGAGDAGVIKVTSSEFFAEGTSRDRFNGSGLFGQVGETASGRSLGIEVQSTTLTLQNGAQITTTSEGSAKAGDIDLFLTERLVLGGEETGILANTTMTSSADGGRIFIDPPVVLIQDGATISVSSEGIGQGGDIILIAGNLTLTDNAAISAVTRSNTGGNITLTISDLLQLVNNSSISTTAGDEQFGGNGGNITIDIPQGFIITTPTQNTDITANAFSGNGGQIFITTAGLFGIEFRDNLTPLSDITASSQLGDQGIVTILLTEPDAQRGLTQLPEEARDPTIADSCQNVGGRTAVELLQIGRGGLPARPDEPLNTTTVWIPLIEDANDGAENDRSSSHNVRSSSTTTALIPIAPCQN